MAIIDYTYNKLLTLVMLSLVDSLPVCDDLPTDDLVIDCVNSGGRPTTVVLEEAADDISAMNSYMQFVYNVHGCIDILLVVVGSSG